MKRLSIASSIVIALALSGCHRERDKLSADCTEVGASGSANGIEPCLKLAQKYPSASDNGLQIAWSGIQMHCSYDAVLTPARQKECDKACTMMRSFAEGNAAPDGLTGGTYVRKGTASGECAGTASPGAGGKRGPGVGLTQ